MTVNLYHLLDNTRADSRPVIYFAPAKVFTEADDSYPTDSLNGVAGQLALSVPWRQGERRREGTYAE
jgi:hypothetical protein